MEDVDAKIHILTAMGLGRGRVGWLVLYLAVFTPEKVLVHSIVD